MVVTLSFHEIQSFHILIVLPYSWGIHNYILSNSEDKQNQDEKSGITLTCKLTDEKLLGTKKFDISFKYILKILALYKTRKELLQEATMGSKLKALCHKWQ